VISREGGKEGEGQIYGAAVFPRSRSRRGKQQPSTAIERKKSHKVLLQRSGLGGKGREPNGARDSPRARGERFCAGRGRKAAKKISSKAKVNLEGHE